MSGNSAEPSNVLAAHNGYGGYWLRWPVCFTILFDTTTCNAKENPLWINLLRSDCVAVMHTRIMMSCHMVTFDWQGESAHRKMDDTWTWQHGHHRGVVRLKNECTRCAHVHIRCTLFFTPKNKHITLILTDGLVGLCTLAMCWRNNYFPDIKPQIDCLSQVVAHSCAQVHHYWVSKQHRCVTPHQIQVFTLTAVITIIVILDWFPLVQCIENI